MHLTKQKRQQEGSNVAAIHIGIGHEDDFVVTGPGNVEGFFVILSFLRILPLPPDSGSERHNEGPDFLV